MTSTPSDIQLAIKIVSFEEGHFADVGALWREAFPDLEDWRAPDVAIPAKRAVQPELFLVALGGERVIGTAMAGYDGHRGWLYSVAVRAACRRQGVGTALIREAERRLAALGCAKINLQIVPANAAVAAFYRRLGYEIEERICMGKPIGRFARAG